MQIVLALLLQAAMVHEHAAKAPEGCQVGEHITTEQLMALEDRCTSAVQLTAAEGQSTLEEVPTQPQNYTLITTDMLVRPTIAYCARTGQVRCENSVSSYSGGTKVVVCKRGQVWWVNRCPKP